MELEALAPVALPERVPAQRSRQPPHMSCEQLPKNTVKTYPALLAALAIASAPALRAQAAQEPANVTYNVEQTVTLSGIPEGSRTVKWWISIPGDDSNQEVLDLAASVPGKWSVVTEPDRGNRFLFTEVSSLSAPTLTAKFNFTLRRRAVLVAIDPQKVGPVTDSVRQVFAGDLLQDAPHMEVTPAIAAMAAKACGAESNPAVEAKLLQTLVAGTTVHYSRDPSKSKFSPGDAETCLAHGGGTCTDIHSLFIALARARGIPARLQMGYRLREANEGKNVDPGYRCWAEYFLPGYGWVPTDLVEAEDPKGLGPDRWFSGLTARRLWLNQGREFNLPDRASTSHRVNTMIIGYAEIDGVEARVLPEGDKPAQLSRTVMFTEVKSPAAGSVALN
jgi:transglutaminase-like putative cysteine protease